jgi:hypothetical protein
LTFEDDVIAVDLNYVLWLDGAGEAARVGVAEEWTRVDYKVT